jgi:photosystem II stability/assembly factor-like uncharacterized protein
MLKRLATLVLVAPVALAQAAPPPAAARPPHAAYSFRNVAIVGGGFIPGILAHPTARNLFYVRTDIGGAYRWDEKAQQWIPLTDWVTMANNNMLGIESMAVDPTDANKLYLAAGAYSADWSPNGSILRSQDQGRTFQVVPVPFKMGSNEDGRSAGERLAVDPALPSTLFMGTRHDGLWKSLDSARTWARVGSFPGKSSNGVGVVFVLFDAVHRQSPTRVLYAGVSSPDANLFRSKDAGQTWEAVPGSPAGLLPNHGVLASDGWLYLTYSDQPGPNGMTNGAVWKWNTKTGEWKNITPEVPGVNKAPSFGYGGLAVDPRHPQTVMAATMDRWTGGDDIYRSTDGGSHWASVKEDSVRDASLSPYLMDADGKIGFGHWIGALAIDPLDANHAMYGTGATLWATHDLQQLDAQKTVHWTVGARGIEETAVLQLVSPPKGPHLLSGLGDIGCFRHEDFTVSPRHGSMKDPKFSDCSSLDFAASDPDLMVRVGGTWGGQAHGAFSADNGLTWKPFATEPAGSEVGGQIAISADGTLLVWRTAKGALSVSADHGATWKPSSSQATQSIPNAQVVSDRVHPTRFFLYDPDKGLLSVGDGPAIDFHALALKFPTNGKIVATPGHADDLWFPCRTGLWHADVNDKSPSVTKIAGVDEAFALGFGRAATAKGYPTLFLMGKVAGQLGLYRSTDEGQHWVEIDDDQHHWGWVNSISGDPRIAGRVYIGTNGRGVLVGDPAK